ncbi:hypothetical protein AYJ10_12475 [Serratia marcescens]|nr:hypothetical protein AYJ10_12475 [Serratia marcescens]
MMTGTWKEKGSTANAALWGDCFLNQKLYQYIAEPQDRHYESFVGQPSGDSLDFLRRSALSFRPQASSTQDEKLALGCSAFSTSMLASISSIISCGKRIPLYVDLLFLCPVAIVPIFHGKCFNTYDDTACCPDDEVFKQKILDVFKHMALWYLNTKEKVKTTNAKPHSARNTYGVSNHNVNWSNIMACSHDTQTRPKFVYLFLGTPNEFPDSTPTVLRAEADSEDDARAKFPRWTLTFAAQIRTAAPCRLQIFSTDDGFMWVYEQRQAAPEVAHA